MTPQTFLLVVVYIRVSTDGQNIAMQLAAAQDFLKDVPEDQRLILIDDGVSALKVKMRDRPKLKELLELIRAGKVGTLVVYDRDRLARNFYEYLEIARLLQDQRVNVIFTATNVRPFDQSIVIEAIGAMFAQVEGQTIVRRRADAQRQFPSSLLGYTRHKSEDGKVTFTHGEQAATILEFFESVAGSTTADDFLAVLKEFKARLKRGEVRLLEMLRTPFYAGCWERGGALKELEHVRPIVPVELYEDVQHRLDTLKTLIDHIAAPNVDQALVEPYCGLCGRPMKYRRDRLQNQSFYACSNHKTSSVSSERLHQVTKQVLEQKLRALNVEAVMSECGAWLKDRQSKVSRQMVALEHELSRCALQIVNNYGAADTQGLVNQLLSQQKSLERQLSEARLQRETFDILSAQLHLLAELVTRHLRNELARPEEMNTLARMLVRRLDVYPGRVQFQINFSRFFTDGGGIHVAS
ncbi:recombinase family protein [Alicyclobacillus tolerans]|uniref:DNA invertase Pin-like site-specific DNA recombinase n=1 Tax=Alicyclobacillus tolerans TaxID=90970 RepID=A0ABT9LZL6_9BACL|nr:recombinase family protein [Alicyclobacillus tengchongensis]MDP9729676.1 DNA invertase Pin-like site-specific DNA recombinase [Alicyclobacillus tengchongensis]